MHDVERAGRERDREVGAYADRDSEARAARHRHGGAEGDQLGIGAACKRAPAGGEVAGAVRRRQHGDGVTARTQLACQPGDVLVDVVRLRPGKGGYEGDAECHPGLRL